MQEACASSCYYSADSATVQSSPVLTTDRWEKKKKKRKDWQIEKEKEKEKM